MAKEFNQYNTTNTSSNSDYYGYSFDTEFDILDTIITYIWYWGSYLLVLFSLFGNILIIIVMSKPWIRKSSTSVFFTALAVSDIAVCVVPAAYNLVLGYLYENVRVDFSVALALSQSQVILTGITLKTSHSFLCLITTERVLSIYFPHKIKLICTSKLSKVAVISIFLFFLVTEPVLYRVSVEYYIHVFFTFRERIQNGVLLLNIWYLVFVFFIPIFVTLTGTILIVIKLHIQTRLMIQQDEINKRKARISNSITRTLLAANFTFIVLQIPYGVLTIAEDCIWPYNDPYRPISNITQSLMYFFAFLSQLNSGINFFLYVLSGSRFREEVKKLVCRSACCRKAAIST